MEIVGFLTTRLKCDFFRNVSKGSIDKVDNNDNQKDDWDDMNRPAKMIKV